MSTLIDALPAGRDWLLELPEYQRQTLASLPPTDDPLGAATQWLEASGPSDTAPHGIMLDTGQVFLLALLKEVRKLLCTDEGYEEERADLRQNMKAGRLVLVTAVAGAVSQVLGASPILLAPPVAIALNVILNAATASGCEALATAIDARVDAGLSLDALPEDLSGADPRTPVSANGRPADEESTEGR